MGEQQILDSIKEEEIIQIRRALSELKRRIETLEKEVKK